MCGGRPKQAPGRGCREDSIRFVTAQSACSWKASSIRCNLSRLRSQWAVGFRTPVAVELPGFPDLGDHVEIQVGDQHFILIAAGLSDDRSPRIAEIALAVKLADIPRLLTADTVDRPDKISVRDRVRGLLKFPEMFRESGYSGRRIEDNFGAV